MKGYVKFTVSENYLFFRYIEILFNKHAAIDVGITAADTMRLFFLNNDFSLL